MRVGRANDINGTANLLRNLAILAENQMAAYFSAPFTGDVKFRYKTLDPFKPNGCALEEQLFTV